MNKLRNYRQVGDDSVVAGRGPGQMGWYQLAAKLTADKTVLDVGCGTARGLRVLQENAEQAIGQDLDPRLASDDIYIKPVEDFDSNCVDVVTCVDVIEHVQEDSHFLDQLCRIARQFVFITTPLSWKGRPLWPYHVREYRLREFIHLLEQYGTLTLYKGTSSGDLHWKVTDPTLWLVINDMLNNTVTNIPIRVLQKMLPNRFRNQSHQAALLYPMDSTS